MFFQPYVSRKPQKVITGFRKSEIDKIMSEMTNTEFMLWCAEAKIAKNEKEGDKVIKHIRIRPLTRKPVVLKASSYNSRPIDKFGNPLKTFVAKVFEIKSVPPKEISDVNQNNCPASPIAEEEQAMDDDDDYEEVHDGELVERGPKKLCPHAGLNYGPLVYKTNALPLSYKGAVKGTVRFAKPF